MKHQNYYKKALKLLDELHKDHPTYTLGQHISTAFSDYPDMWPLSSKEFFYALEKYNSELELDIMHVAPDDYVREIEEDGLHLFDEDPEEDDFN